MFVKNKYEKVYWKLINYRKNNIPDGYVEKHHIIPKSLGGTNEKENIVSLTSREHFFAHRLLAKITEGEANIKMMWAVHRMLHSKNYYISSRTYENLRKNHILFLKENHHAHRIPGWSEKMSKQVTAQWEKAEERRKQFSESMKQKVKEWKKDPNYYKEQKRRAEKGGQKMKEKYAHRIEYNGKEYIGWKTFAEKTGISKGLYRKFYLNGIDPIFRVGKDGPMNKEEITFALKQFCDHVMINEPSSREEYKNVLTRIMNLGIINSKQLKLYMESL